MYYSSGIQVCLDVVYIRPPTANRSRGSCGTASRSRSSQWESPSTQHEHVERRRRENSEECLSSVASGLRNGLRVKRASRRSKSSRSRNLWFLCF
jgi:hypothetical protein